MVAPVVATVIVGAAQTVLWAWIILLVLRIYIVPIFRKEVVTSESDRHADADPDAD